jgi:hypothetical protein
LVNKTEDEENEERDQHKVAVVVVCQVINRNLPHTQKPNTKAALLREFLYVVIAVEQGIFVREHREFSHPNRVSCCPQMLYTVMHRTVLFVLELSCGYLESSHDAT